MTEHDVRGKETKDFSKSEAQVTEDVDTLKRVASIVQMEMNKSPALLLKRTDMDSVVAAHHEPCRLDAGNRQSHHEQCRKSSRCSNEFDRALVHSRQASDEGNRELSALAAAAIASHSSDIVDVLNDLMDKAQTQLDETRHPALLQQSLEVQSTQNYQPLSNCEGGQFEICLIHPWQSSDDDDGFRHMVCRYGFRL